MCKEKPERLILGLDLGETSVGWVMAEAGTNGPCRILQTGARVFDSAMDGDYASGNAESRNVARRDARSRRRLLERRGRRMARLRHILTSAGLLPEMDEGNLAAEFAALDSALMANCATPKRIPLSEAEAYHLLRQVFHYHLRALALDRKLEPFEFGRALYHLAQRRGFLSNRKSPPKKDEDAGKVKGDIAKLAKNMEEDGMRTLGEYFSKLDPHQKRIRSRWTSRQMYKDEFEQVWTSQAAFHPDVLTDKLKRIVHRAIFHQRPLKSARHLIGKCAFEKNRRRAPKALPLFQRFRLLQKLVNTEVITPDGVVEPLTDAQRKTLLAILEVADEKALALLSKKDNNLSFARAKKALDLTRQYEFSWEAQGEKFFPSNHTNAALARIFGNRWWEFSTDERHRILEDVLSIQNNELLARRGRDIWGLDKDAADKFAALKLEPGYGNLSKKAMKKFIPLMEKGAPYATAVKEVHPETHEASEPLDHLPPVLGSLSDLRNPVVIRVLTETRKVVNAIIRRYGKPDIIRIELARDLKRSAKNRQDISKKIKKNEADRKAAAKKILDETGDQEPSRTDILKVQLAEECNWTCPYTGQGILMSSLLGQSSQFQIEHMIPFSRSLNNSYINKTLCENEENARKGNRTPFEAYGSDPERWREIIERVKRFRGSAGPKKLRLFLSEEIEDLQDEEGFGEFTERQLRDTAYASKLAVEYVGLLYGGTVDTQGKRRVTASHGGVTAFLRSEWGLNSILGDGPGKSRDDHRHHAVDAVVIALSDASKIKMLSDAAGRAKPQKRFGTVEDPWPDFSSDVRESINQINVSHRVSRKVNGPLHAETNYSPPKRDENGRECVHVRKPLEGLSTNEAKEIVDPTIRRIVLEKLADLGGDPKKVFANPENRPFLTTKNGRRIPVNRVRIRKYVNPFTVGSGIRERHVLTDTNHHIEILETTDKKGRPKWEAAMVSRFEAMRRLAEDRPIVQKDHGPGKSFVFSLSPGETIEMNDKNGAQRLYIVRGISITKKGFILVEYVALNDARKTADIKAAKNWGANPPNTLRKWGCRKVTITPLGEVRRARD